MQYCQKWISSYFLCSLLCFLALCPILFSSSFSSLLSLSFSFFFLPSFLNWPLMVQQNKHHPSMKKYKGLRNFIWVMGFNYPSTNFLEDLLFIELCVHNALTPLSKVPCFIHYYIYSELETYHKAIHTNFPPGYI